MNKRGQKPTESADAIFRDSVADVTPLPQRNQARLEKPLPKPVAGQRLRAERETLADSLSDYDPWDAGYDTGEELNFLRPGLSPEMLRQLRRGNWAIQDELDLHGFTSIDAQPLLIKFLNESRRAGYRCVRVIHGKGLRSRGQEPVLKRKVAVWLAQREEVLAFCQARPTEGGGGAAVVLLK
jgi:DNA-nicking Smr family endonuclease